MKIIQNIQKTEEKFSDVPNFFRVGPKKVGSVGLPEMRQFFFWPYWPEYNTAGHVSFSKHFISFQVFRGPLIS